MKKVGFGLLFESCGAIGVEPAPTIRALTINA